MIGQVIKQRAKSGDQQSGVVEMRAELARKIAAHVQAAGEQTTAIPGLTLYRRTVPTPCYPATYEPSLNVFVQGRKRITLGGTTYLCDESTFLLSSVTCQSSAKSSQQARTCPCFRCCSNSI